MRRFALLLAASALALEKVPLQRHGLAGAVVAGLEHDAGRRRGGAAPGGCAEPDGGRSREGVLGREPGRVALVEGSVS